MLRFLGRTLAGWCLLFVVATIATSLMFEIIVRGMAASQMAAHEHAITRQEHQSETTYTAKDCDFNSRPWTEEACRYLGAWGNIDIQYDLGRHYEGSKGQESVKWYTNAALQGHIAALYKMAKIKTLEAHNASSNEDWGGGSEMMEAYAWFCAWDAQLKNQQAPGHLAWKDLISENSNLEAQFRIAMSLEIKDAPIPLRLAAKRLCQRYVDILT